MVTMDVPQHPKVWVIRKLYRQLKETKVIFSAFRFSSYSEIMQDECGTVQNLALGPEGV